MTKKLYEVLGVSEKATHDEIRTAYKKIALVRHPDKIDRQATEDEKSKATEAFKLITKAKEVLTDPEKRKQYDRGEINDEGQSVTQHGSQQSTPQGQGSQQAPHQAPTQNPSHSDPWGGQAPRQQAGQQRQQPYWQQPQQQAGQQPQQPYWQQPQQPRPPAWQHQAQSHYYFFDSRQAAKSYHFPANERPFVYFTSQRSQFDNVSSTFVNEFAQFNGQAPAPQANRSANQPWTQTFNCQSSVHFSPQQNNTPSYVKIVSAPSIIEKFFDTIAKMLGLSPMNGPKQDNDMENPPSRRGPV